MQRSQEPPQTLLKFKGFLLPLQISARIINGVPLVGLVVHLLFSLSLETIALLLRCGKMERYPLLLLLMLVVVGI